MSSVIWFLSDDIAKKPERLAPRSRSEGVSVKTLALGLFARQALHVTLNGSGFLALALLRRFLVVLATTKLRQDSRLLTGTLEAAQGSIKILVLFYANAWHCSGIPSKHK